MGANCEHNRVPLAMAYDWNHKPGFPPPLNDSLHIFWSFNPNIYKDSHTLTYTHAQTHTHTEREREKEGEGEGEYVREKKLTKTSSWTLAWGALFDLGNTEKRYIGYP